ncbi:MAG: hypothetical protein P8X66_02775 [Maritimibacter sp.]
MDGQIRLLGRGSGRSVRLGVDEVTTAAAAKNLGRTGRRFLIVHADSGWVRPVQRGEDHFLPKLVGEMMQQGIETRLVRARTKPADILLDPAQDHIHIMMGDAPGYRRNLLHVEESYIKGFWYLDEIGVYWNSSLRLMNFAPERINAGQAEYFFNGVSSWMLRENISKAPQPARLSSEIEPAHAVVFTQEIETRAERSHYLSNEQMIRTAAEYDRHQRIYVKFHPNQSKAVRRDLLNVVQDYPNAQVIDASVHDLIEASTLVVTQNSAAGFEALMQKKPVITCAKSDYRHATLTAKTAGDLREALAFGPDAMADFPYEKYFYWFLNRNLLEEAKESFAARAMSRLREKAFL